MKGGNKNAFKLGRDRYTAKDYIATSIYLLNSFFFSDINGLFKSLCN